MRTLFLLLLALFVWLAPQTAALRDKDWHHLWLGGRMVATGYAGELYEPDRQIAVFREADPEGRPPPVWRKRNEILGCFNYPPPAAVAYALLAWMPVTTAAVVNAYLMLLLAVGIAWAFGRFVISTTTWIIPAIAILAYPSFFYNFGLGQNAVWSLAVILGAWCLCNRRRDLLAGLLLSLLICKPNWLVAVGWIPLLHGRWRMLLGLTLGTLAIILVTAMCLGVAPFFDYFEQFRNSSRMNELPGYDLNIKYNALGLFQKWLGPTAPAARILAWGSGLALILGTWWATRGAWQPGTPRFQHLMACSLTAALWVNPHLNYYDLLPCAPCAVVLLQDWESSLNRSRAVTCGLLLLTFVALPWDRHWPYGMILPIPCFALLALWACLAVRARAGHQPIADETMAPAALQRTARPAH